jgi:hypothetical protein
VAIRSDDRVPVCQEPSELEEKRCSPVPPLVFSTIVAHEETTIFDRHRISPKDSEVARLGLLDFPRTLPYPDQMTKLDRSIQLGRDEL